MTDNARDTLLLAIAQGLLALPALRGLPAALLAEAIVAASVTPSGVVVAPGAGRKKGLAK